MHPAQANAQASTHPAMVLLQMPRGAPTRLTELLVYWITMFHAATERCLQLRTAIRLHQQQSAGAGTERAILHMEKSAAIARLTAVNAKIYACQTAHLTEHATNPAVGQTAAQTSDLHAIHSPTHL
jgi:hypothetical protein